jgi:phosphomannomutase
VVLDEAGKLRQLSGDEVGVLLGYYLLTEGPPRERTPLVLTTIVSSQQLGVIAGELGARYDETLTGFRWVGNRAMQLEAEAGVEFVFGYEEALGYSVGALVRDKDGVSAALLFAELAGWCRSRGSSVLAYLGEIQQRYGLYLSAQRSFTLPGLSGAELIRSVIEAFRSRPPESVGGRRVEGVRDYASGVVNRAGTHTPTGLPRSNVLAYELEEGARITLRPSGTEPKIKYYFEVRVALQPHEAPADARERGRLVLEELVAAFLETARERGQPL